MANIAEGNGRGSKPDYVRFLLPARGSLNECVALLLLARDLHMMTDKDHDRLLELVAELQPNLNALIRSLRQTSGLGNNRPR